VDVSGAEAKDVIETSRPSQLATRFFNVRNSGAAGTKLRNTGSTPI
jgi:hypothetical protein